jgi:FkbM family methyltransferase
LAALGGRLLPGAARAVQSEGDPIGRLRVAADGGEAALIVVEVKLEGDRAQMVLLDAAGHEVDHAELRPSPAVQVVGLLAPDGADVAVMARAASGGARLAWRAAEAVAFADMPAVAWLMPRTVLAADADWVRFYGPAAADDWLGQLRERAYRNLRGPCEVAWIEGLKLDVDPGNELYRSIVLSGLYEPDLMVALARHLPPGGIFVDAGANAGVFTVFGAGRVGAAGRVIAFEPSAREFGQLQRNVALNGFSNVVLHRAAVAEAAGMLDLRVAEVGHAGHNTIGVNFAYPETALLTTERVPAVTLDAVLAGEIRCDAIKMDIEGAELRALQGAVETLRRLRPVLAIEMNGAALAACGASAPAVMDFLAAHEYVAHDIDPASGALLPGCAVEPGVSKNIFAVPARLK